MNVKLISKALHTLSLLSDEDYELALKLRALTEDERQILMLVLEPQKKTTKKTTTERKIEHCVACNYTKRALVHKDPNADGYHEFQSAKGEKKASKSSQSSSKSPRASGMAAALNRSLKQQREMTNDGADATEERCTFEFGDNSLPCRLYADDNVHHLSSHPDYHPFSPAAPPAPAPSPANGGATTSTANSEIAKDTASTVAHGAGAD